MGLRPWGTGQNGGEEENTEAPGLIQATILLNPPLPASSAQPPAPSRDGKPRPGFTARHRTLRGQSSTEHMVISPQFLPPGTDALNWPVENLEAQAQLNLDLFQFVPPMPRPTAWHETGERVSGSMLLIICNTSAPKLAQQIVTSWKLSRTRPLQ